MAKARKTATAKQSGGSAKSIGIPEPNRKAVAEELNKLLADEMLVYVKTRKFHWNIVGPQFHDLHLLLEKQYDELATVIDEIAERIRQVGFFPDGSMKQFLAETHLKENDGTGGIKIDALQELIDAKISTNICCLIYLVFALRLRVRSVAKGSSIMMKKN